MVYEFKLPDVGDDAKQADLLKWMVSEGDGVREDDPIAEVETERAIIEIPSPVDGKVLELCAEERGTVKVGETLVRFDTDEDGDEEREEGGVEILDNEGNTTVEVDAEGEEGKGYAEVGEDDDRTASPSTKLLAREVGVDIDDVEGSGPDGRVVAQDVLRAAKEVQDVREEKNGRRGMEEERAASRPTEEEIEGVQSGDRAPTVEPETAEETTIFGGEKETEAEATEDETKAREEVEQSDDEATDEKDEPRRKEVEEEKKEQPESSEAVPQAEEEKEGVGETDRSEPEAYLVTHHDTANAERLVAVTERLGKDVGDSQARTAFVVKACSVALGDADFDTETDGRRGTNIRVVTRNDGRTRSFVVEKVGDKGISEVAAEIDEADNASSEETTEENVKVYDAGTVGREGTTPVPNRPGTAAVAVGEVRKRPCVVGDEVVARHTVPLSLTFDRRVAGEAEAARFLEDLRRYVEEPLELFL